MGILFVACLRLFAKRFITASGAFVKGGKGGVKHKDLLIADILAAGMQVMAFDVDVGKL